MRGYEKAKTIVVEVMFVVWIGGAVTARGPNTLLYLWFYMLRSLTYVPGRDRGGTNFPKALCPQIRPHRAQQDVLPAQDDTRLATKPAGRLATKAQRLDRICARKGSIIPTGPNPEPRNERTCAKVFPPVTAIPSRRN